MVIAYKARDWHSLTDKLTKEVDVAMDSLCPVCNGFTDMQATCPACNQMIQDAGKLSDLYGKYSPYRPIDALKQTNGIAHDLADRTCVHVGWCPACREEFIYHVGEWTGVDPSWHAIE
ncbi:hypothetical protein ACI7RC_22790 [Brevibacillus sp. B_LB10_24]|uniref:hypothetical protein n=1 Tax=Brevibacillus sp. B_LB10_24 TaxID=3380645 RepID=UPI0038B93C50